MLLLISYNYVVAVVQDMTNGAGAVGLIPGPVKSDTMLPPARQRCDVSSELCCPDTVDAEMGPAVRYALRRNTAIVKKV